MSGKLNPNYYIVRTTAGTVFHLPMGEGDRLNAVLDTLRDHPTADDPMFVSFRDRTGADHRVRAALIEYTCESTPEFRAIDREICKQIDSEKDWGAT